MEAHLPTRQLLPYLPGKHPISPPRGKPPYPASTPFVLQKRPSPTRQPLPYNGSFLPFQLSGTCSPTQQQTLFGQKPVRATRQRAGGAQACFSEHFFSDTSCHSHPFIPSLPDLGAYPATYPARGSPALLSSLKRRKRRVPQASPSRRCHWQTRKWGECLYSTKLAAGLRSVARNNKATRLLTRPG